MQCRVAEARELYLRYRGAKNVIGEKSWETLISKILPCSPKSG
jgi:hypothetical protein